MKEQLSFLFSAVGVFLLLPCVLTFFISGGESCGFSRKITLEQCLPALTQTQISAGYGIEMKKAQSVMVRTNVRMQLEAGHTLAEIIYDYYSEWEAKGKVMPLSVEYEEFQQAAEATCDEILTYEEELAAVPYHRISSQMTRNGKDVLPGQEMDYLTAVESPGDKDAEDYATIITVEKQQLPKELEILERDKSGYVLKMRADEQIMLGENFRIQMGLPSSCFSMEESGTKVRFFCRGQGHGLGLSQYGGSVLEKEGMDYQEILNYYFPGLTLEKRT